MPRTSLYRGTLLRGKQIIFVFSMENSGRTEDASSGGGGSADELAAVCSGAHGLWLGSMDQIEQSERFMDCPALQRTGLSREKTPRG